jgi:hemerythrin-like domain-containing protein
MPAGATHPRNIHWGVCFEELRMGEAARVATKHPLDLIIHEHDLQSRLCDLLEQIADCLPDNVSPPVAQAAASAMSDLHRHHKHEEKGLFPLLQKRAKPQDNIEQIISHLEKEHAADESLADDLLENLETLAVGNKSENPNMLGYMLRGFFESYRRHISWENTVLLPLARERLTKDDLDILAVTLSDA